MKPSFNLKGINKQIVNFISDQMDIDEIHLHQSPQTNFIEIKAQQFLSEELESTLFISANITEVKRISPILPMRSRMSLQVPFITCEEVFRYNQGKDLDHWELASHYESVRANIHHQKILSKMEEIVEIIRKSIRKGLACTPYKDRILG